MGAKVFGEQNPTQGETAVSWQTWSDGVGSIPTVDGNADWGKLKLDLSGEEGRSAVYDLGSAIARTFTLTENRYGTGAESAVLQIRGDASTFTQDSNTIDWETYSSPISRSWRYVQIRETTRTSYFIDNTVANDNDTGLSPDHAWKTIAKVNSSSFSPGDNILLKRGQLWRETLIIDQSGSIGNPITIGAYGTGADPIISGAGLLTSWTNHAGNVWKTTLTYEPYMVLFDSNIGNPQITIDTVDSQYDFFWSTNVLYVYSSGGDPNTVYTTPGVEVPVLTHGIWTNNVQNIDYIDIKNIKLYGQGICGIGEYGGAAGIHSVLSSHWNYTNVTLEKVACTGVYGSGVYYHIFDSCTITGVRNMIGFEYGKNAIQLTGYNSTYPGGHNKVTNSTITYWGGSAVLLQGESSTYRSTNNESSHNTLSHTGSGCYLVFCDYTDIFDNICDDNVEGGSHSEEYGIALRSSSHCDVYDNTCTNNGDGIELWGYHGVSFPDDGYCEYDKVYRNIFGGNIYHGILVYEGDCNYCEIHTNLVYWSHSAGIYLADFNTGYESTNCTLYNNTIVNNTLDSGGEAGIVMRHTDAGWTVKNNLVFDNAHSCLWADTGAQFVHSNNCYYRATGTVLYVGGTIYTLSQVPNYEASAVNTDPKLTSIVTPDLHIASDSPCINAGVDVGLTSDYDQNSIVGNPDIGAYEYTAP